MTQDALIPTPKEPRPNSPRRLADHPLGWLRAGGWRAAKATRCRRCKAWTVTGLDADECAFEAVCDLDALSPLGEALALLAGRRTLEARQRSGRLVLTRRNHHAITARPAGTPRLDVLAVHACGADQLPTIPTTITRPARLDPDAPCPF